MKGLPATAFAALAILAPLAARAQIAAPAAPSSAPSSTSSASSTLGASPGAPASGPQVLAGPLSLSDALDATTRTSFTLGSAQSRIASAQARLSAAGAFAGTTLAIARAFGKNTGGFDEDIILSQVIEIGKKGSRVRGARADIEAARFDRAGAGTDLAFALRSAYFEALRADVEQKLAQDALATTQSFQNAAQISFTAGDAPRANVVRSQIELSRAQAALTAAQSEREVRYAALRSLLAVPDESPLELKDALAFAPASYDLPALLDLALAKRADVQSARASLQSRQFAVSSARSASRPDAFVEARRAALTPYSGIPNGTSLRVGVVIPLLDFGRNRAGVQEAQAGVAEQQGTLDEALRLARLDVSTALARLNASQKAVQGFDEGRLARSKELLEMAQIGYERGANSTLELLDAQSVYRTEQADYARALALWNIARADLQRAVGGELP